MHIGPLTFVGIALIVLGIVAFTYRGIPYTSREKVIDIGSVEAGVGTRKTIPMSSFLIGVTLVSGIALAAVGSRKSL
jgi:hypothetical protein